MPLHPPALPRHASYDAVVIGARCAGAATAMLLARGGQRVLCVDRSARGTDTLSTHALMRAGVLQLARWGLLDAVRASDTPPVCEVTFHYGETPIAVPIKPKGELDALYAPRRTVLDPLLAQAAQDSGVELLHGVRLDRLIVTHDRRVTACVLETSDGTRATVDAALVIGADGLKSKVAQLVQAPVLHETQHAAPVAYAYFEGLSLRGYHWYFAPNATAGAIPTSGGQTCVFVSLPPAQFARTLGEHGEGAFLEALACAAPELARALWQDARRIGPLRLFAGRRGVLRAAHGAGYALVGDAGCFKDPCTAHGITDALRDAELLARAVLAGGSHEALSAYQATRDALAQRFLQTADAIASYAWDLDAVQAQHRLLSEVMADEVRLIERWDAPAAASEEKAA